MNLLLPQYRKYTNDRSYFKISSETTCEETQVIGQSFMVLPLEAKQFPEKLFIKRLLDASEDLLHVITEEEYLQFLTHCKTKLRAI